MRSAEDDLGVRPHGSDRSTREDHVDQREGHRGDAHDVACVPVDLSGELGVAPRQRLGVEDLDPMIALRLDVAGELEKTQGWVEAAVLLDDGWVLADELVKAGGG
jgi:hypothetical protein